MPRSNRESFYGSPPDFFPTKSPVFETSSRPYLLKHDVPCRPDVTVRYTFASMKMFEDAFFMASFLVSSKREMFVEENRRLWAGLS